MNVSRYLARIGFTENPCVDATTLRALHRAHLLTIPYENLDIHLGRELVLDEAHIFEKLVIERRGGWCFEMNGLLAWALRDLGFDVRLLGGAVNRALVGERAERNHLVLLVQLEQPYLVDVGFGNGFLEPLPLVEGEYEQDGFVYKLRRGEERWQFENHANGGPGFDFTLAPHALSDFAEQCHELQTSPDSGFVRLTVCHRRTPDGVVSLRGAVLARVTANGETTSTITSAEEYAQTLRTEFDLDSPDLAALWPIVWERHIVWLQSISAAM